MRFLLYPLALLYGLGMFARNKLFDLGLLRQVKFNVPVIVVGNLNAGGSGKSPMVRYLAEMLMTRFNVAILSRGYGRRTMGYLKVNPVGTAQEFGDEPLQYAQDLQSVKVFVCEDRVEGIGRILSEFPDTQVVLLDDAFQHRYVKSGLSLLLTSYDLPFTQDHLLPVGHLREPATSARRADVLLVTKCPVKPEVDRMHALNTEFKKYHGRTVFYSYIHYRDRLTGLYDGFKSLVSLNGTGILLVCGIAQPQPLIEYVQGIAGSLHTLIFKDHHPYSVGDVIRIKKEYMELSKSGNCCILTTRKDAVRLQSSEIRMHLKDIPVWVLDIEPVFYGGAEVELQQKIINYVETGKLGS